MLDTSKYGEAISSEPDRPTSVFVWDRFLRLWHWMLVAVVLVAWFTPNTHDGLHRLAGYAVIGLLVFRVAWGFFGTRYSRFHRLPAKLRAFPSFLWNLRQGRTGSYLGLNPAGAAMLVALLIALTVSGMVETWPRCSNTA